MTRDLELRRRVIEALEFEPSIDPSDIGVAARDGVVSLSGHVGSFVEKFTAERTVRQVKGVKAVAQSLEVRLPSEKKLADDEIAARAVRLLDWDVSIPQGRIMVAVEHGIVTLTGEVDWHFQRAEAAYDVRKLSGVRSVVNDIGVAPKIKAGDVRAKIHAALERLREGGAGNVTVAVSGTKVTLGGTARSWSEREAVERAAWSTPGVTDVDDHIEMVYR
jgi:osmotically-inducible protein OsmY